MFFIQCIIATLKNGTKICEGLVCVTRSLFYMAYKEFVSLTQMCVCMNVGANAESKRRCSQMFINVHILSATHDRDEGAY